MNGFEDQSVVLQKNYILENFIDVDKNDLEKIKITKLPTHGNLILLNNPITINQEIIFSSFDQLWFDPEQNWYGETNFSWMAHDG